MTSPAYSILYSAVVSTTAESGLRGDVLIPDLTTGNYVKATTENRAGRRATGIALSDYAAGGVVDIQQTGQVSTDITGFTAGAASWVRTSALGRLEKVTPSAGDDLLGKVDTDGRLFLGTGYWDSSNAIPPPYVAPTGTGVNLVLAGAQVAAASLGAALQTLRTNAGATNVEWASPPTGSGLYTGTSDVADTAAKPVGSGFYTWIATPSSANLSALMTDKSGTGLLTFATAPLFKTTINLNNPGDTFKYVITPAAIAADRTLTLPLLAGNDTAVCEAFTQSLTNKTVVLASNTVTDTGAVSTDFAIHDGTRFVKKTVAQALDIIAAGRLTPLDAYHTHAWEMTDTSGDLVDTGVSASKVNLTVAGTPIYNCPGLLGNCIYWGVDGTGASATPYASALTSAFSDLPVGAATIEAWVSGYELSSGGLIAGGAKNGTSTFVINHSGTSASFDAVVSTAVFSSPSSNPRMTPTGPWHYVALTLAPGFLAGTGTAILYVDGEVAAAVTNQFGGAQSGLTWNSGVTPTFWIGRNNSSGSGFVGKISRVRLSSICRTQTEIRAVWKRAMGY